jgi:hypothetical protein
MSRSNAVQAGSLSSEPLYTNVKALAEYLKKNRSKGITQQEVARRLEFSPAVISQYLRYKYDKGDLKRLNEIVGNFLAAEAAYAAHTPVVEGLAETSQVQDVFGAIHYVERHKLFGLVVGEAGLGKSIAFKEYAKTHRHNTLLLTLDPLKSSKSAFIKFFWSQIPGNTHKRISASVMMNELVAYLRNKHKTVLIDEAQFLSMDALEMARSIQDQTGIGFVLGGTFNLDREFGLNGHDIVNEQLHSRVLIYCRLKSRISKQDLSKVIALYGVDDPRVVAWFYKRCNRTGRRYRWICALLKSAWGLSNDRGCDLTVDLIEEAEGLTGLY